MSNKVKVIIYKQIPLNYTSLSTQKQRSRHKSAYANKSVFLILLNVIHLIY